MPLANIDELNNGTTAKRIDYEEYFDMEYLTEEQKQERIAFSRDMEAIMLFAFSLISLLTESGDYGYIYVIAQIVNRYEEVLTKYNVTDIDSYLSEYVNEFSNQITTTTLDNLATAYFLSQERASVIAVNEADTILNRKDYFNAIMQGKTKKQWIDVKDRRERKTHLRVGGKIIPINDLFMVGNSVMMFPHDGSYGADANELVNCRCGIKYL